MTPQDLEKLIEFVIKDAFEGLDYTDPFSVENAIRKWVTFNLEAQKNECEHLWSWFPLNKSICLWCGDLKEVEYGQKDQENAENDIKTS